METNEPSGAGRTVEELIPAGTINFPATDLNQVLQIYSELVNRTVLRPANLPAPLITLKTQTPLTKKEAIEAFDAVLEMNGITMINIGDKFVKAVPTTQANQEGAPFNKLDAAQLPEVGQYVTHVVQLKYVKPSEMVPVLQPFSKLQGSLLPIDTSQILVLRDYSENIKRMLEMIKEIDVSVPSEFVSEVIPIKYAKASDISDALNSLGGGGGGTSIGRSSAGATGRTGGATLRPGSPGYATGGAGVNSQMGAQGTTTPPGAAGQTAAPGSSFTDRLRSIIKGASSSGDLQIIGQTKIIADERSNSLLIFASRPDMDMIKSIVAKLDVVLAQVLIRTVILDVQLNNGWNYSLSAGEDPRTTGAYTLGGTANSSDVSGNTPLNTLAQFFSGIATTNMTTALPASQGLGYFGRYKGGVDIALQAAASDSRINVVQTPQILTTHATPGSIFVGSTVPYITSSYYGGYGGSPSSSYQQLQVGVGLTVTPYINQDGLVVMEINETIDEISGSIAIANVGNVPTTTSRQISAEVAVRDGESIVLGGFVRNSDNKSSSGVPILRDIPILGALFDSKSDTKQREELLVLMEPKVLRTPDIAALEATNERKTMPGVRNAEAEIRRDEKKAMELQDKDERRWKALDAKENNKLDSEPQYSTPPP